MKMGEQVLVSREQRVDFLRRVRAARSMILKDSESFHRVVSVIEHVGQSFGKKIGNGLNDYRNPILDFIVANTAHERHEFDSLFSLVRNARNDAVHGGAYIRHHTSRLNQLLIALSEALMSDLNQARDLMVDDPVVAYPWQQVAELRRQMLSHSFSYIPVVDMPGHPNGVISEVALAKMLNVDRGKRKRLLAVPLKEAIQNKTVYIEKAPTCSPESTKSEFLGSASHLPTLVKEDGRLVGIITAFDLL